MVTLASLTGTYAIAFCNTCSTSRAVEVAGAFRKACIISRPITMGCPCLPSCSGTTAQYPDEQISRKRARNSPTVALLAAGRSTKVIIAASRPWFRTSCNPTWSELNCPRRLRVDHHERAAGKYHWLQRVGVRSRHNNHQIAMRLQALDGRSKEGSTLPGEQRFVARHARGFARRQNHARKTRSPSHIAKISNLS